MPAAKDITKKSKSNLAFTLLSLPKEARHDMITFYAFCRIIDDIADDPHQSVEKKETSLDQWSRSLEKGIASPQLNPIQPDIFYLIQKYALDKNHFLEIIKGCKSDIYSEQKFGSWDELKQYTYRVASCVGLIAIKIFGCTNPLSEIYAEKLGHALQYTNILRDVGHDLKNGNRIYLPHQEMIRFQYSERDLVGRVYDGRFIAMMHYHAERAETYYREAQAAISPEDKHALRASEAMRKIYFNILQKMKADNFQVFTKEYKLSKLKKFYHLLT